MLTSLKKHISETTEDELAFIASLDYGQAVVQHMEALSRVLQTQDGCFANGQYYFPYEVVELGSHAITSGHEREFVLCTLLVINAVVTNFDTATDLSEKFDAMTAAYDLLPSELRENVLSGYLQALKIKR